MHFTLRGSRDRSVRTVAFRRSAATRKLAESHSANSFVTSRSTAQAETDWTEAIAQAWKRRSAGTLADTLELARLVSQARESLKAMGQWSGLFRSGRRRLPF